MATLGKEFDPNKKYKVVLSERLKNQSVASRYSVSSVQVDSETKLPNAVRSSAIKPGFAGSDCNFEVVSATDGQKSAFKGSQKSSKGCTLTFDPSTQTFTLERIDTEFTFGQSPPSPTSDNQSEDGIINALIEQEGAADTENPYDWRHQLNRQRTPTPELEQFDPLGIDALGTLSPDNRPLKPRPGPRRASTPPEQPTIELGASPSPEPELQTRAQRQEEEEEEEDSDDGGLEIVMDGAAKPRHRFRGRFNQRLDAAPISLRSAASSQSPAMHNAVAADSEDSDEDVDEMKLGSPMTQRRREGEEAEPEQEPEAGDGFQEDFDMEDEFAKALQGDDEEEAPANAGAAAAAPYVDDSSSESEEE